MIKLRPLRDRVWVRKHEASDTTAGGIIVPDNCKDPPMTGEVLAVGPGGVTSRGYRDPMTVAPGDRVIFCKYDGMNATIDGEKVYVVPQRDILCTY